MSTEATIKTPIPTTSGFHSFAFYILIFEFSLLPFTTVESALQIRPFMQNKPNFQKSQMNVNLYNTTDYENKSNWTLGENEPNTNPIKPNLRKAKMNVNSLITKDYRKKDDFTVQKNKPNSNPISVKPKMNVNLYVIKEYENETAFRLKQNKPNQTQSPRPTSEIIVDSLSCGSRLMAAARGEALYRPQRPRESLLKMQIPFCGCLTGLLDVP